MGVRASTWSSERLYRRRRRAGPGKRALGKGAGEGLEEEGARECERRDGGLVFHGGDSEFWLLEQQPDNRG